ncbi:hypothetical protein FISHEDRAFT_79066 [Fistulina hepatica ATCC 64428]|uniref:Uncharacterized protein n=1 Tax=Fistulina hepatica ATCC 64428 TaxID=1128425 RepID=A0A0D6ZZA0_9AGAR|nr:hypothetical protein FISHEDRAFT_79066 [Fistulina hepatica ATCC 64428]
MSSSRQGNNTLNYLFLRSAWIGHLMTDPHPRGLLAQDWRDLLGWSAYRTSSSANPSDMGPSERRVRELLGSIFGKRDLNHLPPFIDFNGSQLSMDHLPEHEVYWDLAWEVNEANARLDLVHFLMHGVDDGNILARTDLVEGAIFPQSQTDATTSFWTPSAMDFVELDGLCLKDPQERLLWVLSLGRAVSQCPAGSAIPEGLSFLASLEDEQIRHFGCNLAQAHSLEEVIITHYCTCFYNTFSRPPTPPHCLY